MVKKNIHPKYAMWVFIYTIMFSSCSILYGKFLNYLTTKYDRAFLKDGENKSKIRLIIEVGLELGATSVGVYIFRELVDFLIRKIIDVPEDPGAFAAVVVAPVIFAQQPILIEKIKNVHANIFD